MPKLSIIIPVYNEEPYLRRCLDSVRAEDQVEIIVIDDHSTDKSYEIAKEYPQFKVLEQLPSNVGVSASRNRGIEVATGEYITFLDSDDYLYPNAISTMLSIITEHTPEPIIQFNHSREKYDNDAGYYTLSNLPKKWLLVWNKVYRRDFLIEHNILFDSKVIFEEDRIFNLKCFRYCKQFFNSSHRIVSKCFDNKQSICHNVTKCKLLSASNAMTQLLAEEDDRDIQKILRRHLEILWKSDEAKRVFG